MYNSKRRENIFRYVIFMLTLNHSHPIEKTKTHLNIDMKHKLTHIYTHDMIIIKYLSVSTEHHDEVPEISCPSSIVLH